MSHPPFTLAGIHALIMPRGPGLAGLPDGRPATTHRERLAGATLRRAGP